MSHLAQTLALAKFRCTLQSGEVIDDIFAESSAAACEQIERLSPGVTGSIVRLERDDLWFLRASAIAAAKGSH